MSLLKRIENRLEKLFNEIFLKTEKSTIKPIEIALGLVKKMRENSVEGIKKVYSPNLFTVTMNTDDYEKIENYKNTLIKELIDYITQFAGENKLYFIDTPVINFVPSKDIGRGKINIVAEVYEPDFSKLEEKDKHFPVYDPSADYQYTPGERIEKTTRLRIINKPYFLETTGSGTLKHRISKMTKIGRSQECEIVVNDINISRYHLLAWIDDNGTVWLEDQGSTNGTFLNNERISRAKLTNGDEIIIGKTKLTFKESAEQDETS